MYPEITAPLLNGGDHEIATLPAPETAVIEGATGTADNGEAATTLAPITGTEIPWEFWAYTVYVYDEAANNPLPPRPPTIKSPLSK